MMNIIRYVLLALLVVICLLFAYIFFKKENFIINKLSKINIYKLELLFIVCFFALSISYILLPGLIEGHDLSFRISQIQAMADEIKRGSFPALIMTNYIDGYGDGMGIFYTDFFYYIPALLVVLGVSLKASYKIFKVIIVLSSAISMFFCIYKMTKSRYAAEIISGLYITSSYFFTDLYIRADIGENLAGIFIPLIIYGLYEIIYRDYKKGYYLTIGLSGVFLAHILTCYLCIYLVTILVLINIKKILNNKERLKYLFIYGLLSIGIVAFFWLPMFDNMLYDNLKLNNYVGEDYTQFGTVNPLFTVLEIYYDDYSINWVPPGVGIVFIFLLYYFYLSKNKKTTSNSYSNQLVCSGLVFLFMTTSLFPWKLFYSILGIMEFPWRFYLFTTICILMGIGLLIESRHKNNKEKCRFQVLIALFVIFTYTIFTYNMFIKVPMYIQEGEVRYSVGSGVELPNEVKKEELLQRGMIITSNNDIDTSFTKNGTNIYIQYKNNKDSNTYLDLPLTYYKGYKAIQKDEKFLMCEKAPNGIVRVYINDPSNEINVYYGYTTARIIGICISIVSLALYMFVIKNIKKIKYEKNY